MRQKTIVCLLLSLLLVARPLQSFAEEYQSKSDLDINTEAFSEEQSTYYSASDKYGINLFTEDNNMLYEKYRSYQNNQEHTLREELFQSDSSTVAYNGSVQGQAQEIGLFLQEKQMTTPKDSLSEESEASTLANNIGFIALCIALMGFSFFVTKQWQRRRKKHE